MLMHNPIGMKQADAGGLARKKIPTPAEEAAASVYKMADGNFYVPAIAVRSSMLSGAKGSRLGRRAALPFLTAAVIMEEEQFALTDDADRPICTYAIDSRRAVVKDQGIIRSRAKIELPWRVHGFFLFDERVIDSAQPVEDALRNAGLTIGILDYRPERKKGHGGWFGKYEVGKVALVD